MQFHDYTSTPIYQLLSRFLPSSNSLTKLVQYGVMVHFSPTSAFCYFCGYLYANGACSILSNQTSELKLQFGEKKNFNIEVFNFWSDYLSMDVLYCLFVTLIIRQRFVDNNCFFIFFLCVVESRRWSPTNTALIVAFSSIYRQQFEGTQRVKRTDRNIEACFSRAHLQF